MPNFRPRGLAPFPKHKERRPARVHAWQPPFTPTSARDNNRINHKRLFHPSFLTSFATLNLRLDFFHSLFLIVPSSIFYSFPSHSHSLLSLNKSLHTSAHTNPFDVLSFIVRFLEEKKKKGEEAKDSWWNPIILIEQYPLIIHPKIVSST